MSEQVTELISLINAMPSKIADDVDIPLRPFLQIADRLVEAGNRDIDLLKENRYDTSKLEDIALHIQALRQQSAAFNYVQFDTPETAKKFYSLREEAEETRYELLAAMDYAFADDPKLLEKCSRVREGGSHADLIQDLLDIKVICDSNLELLDKIKYDKTLLERIPSLSKELASLLAKATLDKSESSEERVLRDKIFTILKGKMRELSFAGKYAFRHEPNHVTRYSISYTPRKRKSKEVVKEEVVVS